jgi:UDP-N-acetylmuramate--alanine ligase
MALILGRADFDPTVIVGTKLSEFGGKNFRFGEGPYLILEADEYGRAFLNYTPSHVIVTNIDCEHLDIYKDIDEIKNTFLAFLKNTARGGVLVLNRDNPELASLSEEIEKIASEGGLEILWFSVSQSEAKKVKKALKIPGMHNLSNALAAFTLAKKLGVEEETILAAISGFRGAWRRMEYRGDIKAGQRKIPVYDDYAHHPTEIKASLSGFREKYPGARIVCVFQPHQAKRLQALFAEFAAAFEDADEVIILPLYAVAGRDSTPLLDSEKLAAAILQKYPEKNISYLPTCENLKELILDSLEKTNGDAVVVMMGAGDIFLRTQDLI